MQITPNANLANKYAPGDRVWIVFSLEENIKINQFTILGFVAEQRPAQEGEEKKMRYLYAYNVDGEGKENGSVNVSWAEEDLIHFDKKHAQKKAVQLVGDLIYSYREEAENMKASYKQHCEMNQKKFEEAMRAHELKMNSVNAKHLEVEGEEEAPECETQPEMPEVPESGAQEEQNITPESETQPNLESDEGDKDKAIEGTENIEGGETDGGTSEDPQLNDELPQASGNATSGV